MELSKQNIVHALNLLLENGDIEVVYAPEGNNLQIKSFELVDDAPDPAFIAITVADWTEEAKVEDKLKHFRSGDK